MLGGEMSNLSEVSLKELSLNYNELVKMTSHTWGTLAILSVYSVVAIKLPNSSDNSIKFPLVEIILPIRRFLLIALGFYSIIYTLG
jgi:hypothetical protein